MLAALSVKTSLLLGLILLNPLKERERDSDSDFFFLVGTVGIGKLLAEEEKGSWFEDCKV